jgi:protein O-GlcNAc transferase
MAVWRQFLSRRCRNEIEANHILRGYRADTGLGSARRCWESYPNYALGIWQEPFFCQPDVVLVDGRFRVACFIACALMTRSRLTILFDDYKDRKYYHLVERMVAPSEFVDRMAIFRIEPAQIDPSQLTWIVKSFYVSK